MTRRKEYVTDNRYDLKGGAAKQARRRVLEVCFNGLSVPAQGLRTYACPESCVPPIYMQMVCMVKLFYRGR